MNIAKIIDKLRFYNFSDEVYVQSGFNRFKIKTIDITDNGVIIVIEDEADNPPPSYNDIRRA